MHKVIYGIVVSVFALCIISTVPQAVNETDWPSDFNDTNVSSTEEPFIPFSPTQPFETVSTENVTETSAPYSTTESTITESATTPRGATTTSPQETDTDCACDITPGFCDIGCCCDNVDCEIDDLSTVFRDCQRKTRPLGVCVEKWLMFRANVDPALVTVTDTLFCVREGNDTEKILPAFWEQKEVQVWPTFSLEEDPTVAHPAREFYKVDDVILLQYKRISMLGTLKQPSPGISSSLCVDRNPARFMQSLSHSCARAVSTQSCSADSSLSVRSYFEDISLLRVPILQTVDMTDLLIPIVPVMVWPSPSEQNGTCLNIVSRVEYVIEFTHAGEITSATLRAEFLNASMDAQISQQFAVTFQLATPSPSPAPLPAMGLTAGTPVIGRFGHDVKALTTLAPAVACSVSTPATASHRPILFTHNSISGCSFRSASANCTDLRSELMSVLLGVAMPDMVAMAAGPKPEWAEVLSEDCPASPAEDSCETGCLLPRSLSIQFLWARRGLLSYPQSYILGAKYQLGCQKTKCPLRSPLSVTSEVTFSETTAYPEPPRGVPQPHWKFPFDFPTRGQKELDGVR
ncbi:tectonic-3-like [Engraulis encrasicolus]|uniref:tectonic-3-like n=1 Tax=Engraulis encrasicolus TaxID=184585 RepID=UPI002FD69906